MQLFTIPKKKSKKKLNFNILLLRVNSTKNITVMLSATFFTVIVYFKHKKQKPYKQTAYHFK